MLKVGILFILALSSCVGKRTVLITGGNRGVGLAATRQLAATNNWNIIIACRSIERGEAAKASIINGQDNVEVMELDLADLKSIRSFSTELIKSKKPIHVIACNAGIQLSAGKDSTVVQRTIDGFESTVGTNHIGHFYLLQLLIDKVVNDKSSRIVHVGSGVHNPEEPGGDVGSKATLGDLSGIAAGFRSDISMVDGGPYDADKAYKDSKLCNVMTALELHRRLRKSKSAVTSNVMNPGLIPTTGLFRNINPLFVLVFSFLTKYVFKVAVSEEEGGRRLAYMVSSPDLDGVSGKYFSGKPGVTEFLPITPSKEAQDEVKAAKLWDYTDKSIKKALSGVW